MDAIREWLERQKGIVNYMNHWLREAWPQYFVDVRLPPGELSVPYLDSTVLFEITGKVGEPLSTTLPAATGGVPPLTYWVLEYKNDCGVLGTSDSLPAGLSFDPSTRTISGAPQHAGHGTFLYGAYDSHPECQDDFDTIAWKIE